MGVVFLRENQLLICNITKHFPKTKVALWFSA